jgi:hypothetical protein
MRANILNGQLKSLPPSYDWAVKRMQQVRVEVAKIETQLINPETQRVRFANESNPDEAYAKWLNSTNKAREFYLLEQRLTTAWMEENEPPLFRRAYDLLCKLEIDFEFKPEETALMEELEENFAPSCRRKEG